VNPADRYTRLAITLHWLMAVLILGNIVLIKIVDQLPEDRIRLAIDTHKSVGITVLGLFVLRVLWRLAHRPPQLPHGMPAWERRSAHLAHLALYGLLFALPFSGWLHDSAWRAAAEHPMHLFGGFEWPRIAWIMEQEPAFKERLHHWFGLAHEWLADVFYVLLALHVLGALKHQFLDRSKQLQRMWF
jgi:cytochrome b561